jgi:hypothetical protein
MVNIAGQNTAHQLSDIVYDKFTPQEEAEEAAIIGAPVLLVHYQAPLVDGNDVYMMTKSGTYTSCNPAGAWQTGVPCGPNPSAGIVASNTYGFSPLTADAQGNIYYNVIQFADPSAGNPWQTDPVNSWLVKVTPQDATSIATYATLTPNAPGASAQCEAAYSNMFNPSTLPWPPTGFPPVPTQRCGPQRPGANIARAIAATDGTIYTASRAHQNAGFESFLIAVNPDLTPKWAASLQHLLNDGCGVIIPINDSTHSDVSSCRFGTAVGVDPDTNAPGSGIIRDSESSSPTVLPDGSIVFGVSTLYPDGRGHLLRFDALGKYLNEYDYGHDSTPAVYARPDGTFSVIIKDNHYGGPFYCRGNSSCQGTPQVYYIT